MLVNNCSDKFCRVCLSSNISELISFGEQPDSSHLLVAKSSKFYAHDLSLKYCKDCGFVFIRDYVCPDMLYNEYKWVTSVYPASHVSDLCQELIKEFSDSEDFILDIGSNDGYILKLFQDKGFNNVLGIEPAVDCYNKALANKVPTINNYFSFGLSNELKIKYGIPKLIICRHVLEHISELEDFLRGLDYLMDSSTLLVVEFPDFEAISEKGDISSIWEQHVNYFTEYTFSCILKRFNLSIIKKQSVPYGGGSIILYIRKNNNIKQNNNIIALADRPKIFTDNSIKNIEYISRFFENLKLSGNRIVAYGCGARGRCLINITEIFKYLDYVIDDDPLKAGSYMPGSLLPVFTPEKLYEDMPDYCFITPLNSKDTEMKIIKSHSKFIECGGKFIEMYPNSSKKLIEISNT